MNRAEISRLITALSRSTGESIRVVLFADAPEAWRLAWMGVLSDVPETTSTSGFAAASITPIIRNRATTANSISSRERDQRRAALARGRSFAALAHDGLSVRAISRRLTMSRKTVRRILGRKEKRKEKISSPGRASILDVYEADIRQMLSDAPDLRAPAILERLREKGYAGGITILRDLVRTLRPRAPNEAFLTLDFKPGASAQVDWDDFGFAIPGCPRRVSGFVAVLSYSRYLYLEFTLSQAMGTFLRCMERALEFFVGCSHVDIFDNMKTVVRERGAGTRVFNPKFVEYARSRNFAITACMPGKGNQKGRVERPDRVCRERFWRGRRFQDLLDLNMQATRWRDDFANNRIHAITGKLPSLVFKHEEHRHLQPLPNTPFDTDDIHTMTVTKSFRVSFDRNTYSVPWRLVGQLVLIRANDHAVSIFLGRKEVARHARCWRVGEDIEDPSHKEALLEQRPRASASSLPAALAGLGDLGRDYFKLLAANGGSIHREIVRLVFLVELFGEGQTRDAIAEVMKTGHAGAELVEYVMRHKKKLVPAPPPLRLGDPDLDELSFREPDLSLYDELIPHGRRPIRAKRSRRLPMKKGDDDQLELAIEKFRWLRLPGMASRLGEIVETAAKKNLTPLDIARRLADEEKVSRIRSAIDRRVRDARFPEINTVDAFNFDFDPCRKKMKAAYLALLDLSFIEKGINPLFIGHPGTGKTFLARALAYAACQATKRVVVVPAPRILNELSGAEVYGRLERVLRKYAERLTERAVRFVLDGKGYRPTQQSQE